MIFPSATLQTLAHWHTFGWPLEYYWLVNPPTSLGGWLSGFPEATKLRGYIVLCKVNRAKACGPDVAPNWLVKDYAQILHSLLLEPWTPPVRSSGCPVFGVCRHDTNPQKSNLPRTCKKDIRLITLTSCIAKIAEDFALLIKSSQRHCKY